MFLGCGMCPDKTHPFKDNMQTPCSTIPAGIRTKRSSMWHWSANHYTTPQPCVVASVMRIYLWKSHKKTLKCVFTFGKREHKGAPPYCLSVSCLLLFISAATVCHWLLCSKRHFTNEEGKEKRERACTRGLTSTGWPGNRSWRFLHMHKPTPAAEQIHLLPVFAPLKRFLPSARRGRTQQPESSDLTHQRARPQHLRK